jgi:phage/conjugal plasmid C-4 type zinc finger TraR family protein
MAGGWTRDGAIEEQIDDTIGDGVKSARARLPAGPGTLECVECGEDIPEARRRAIPGVTTCVACQGGRDRQVQHALFNRRGSKDSQLR